VLGDTVTVALVLGVPEGDADADRLPDSVLVLDVLADCEGLTDTVAVPEADAVAVPDELSEPVGENVAENDRDDVGLGESVADGDRVADADADSEAVSLNELDWDGVAEGLADSVPLSVVVGVLVTVSDSLRLTVGESVAVVDGEAVHVAEPVMLLDGEAESEFDGDTVFVAVADSLPESVLLREAVVLSDRLGVTVALLLADEETVVEADRV
jgi:hypothetical protein